MEITYNFKPDSELAAMLNPDKNWKASSPRVPLQSPSRKVYTAEEIAPMLCEHLESIKKR